VKVRTNLLAKGRRTAYWSQALQVGFGQELVLDIDALVVELNKIFLMPKGATVRNTLELDVGQRAIQAKSKHILLRIRHMLRNVRGTIDDSGASDRSSFAKINVMWP